MKGLDYTAPSPNRENKFTFNGQTEFEKKLNLNFIETPHRLLDVQLGRFVQADKLVDLFTGITPYVYAYNNPIKFNDPTGLFGDPDPEEIPCPNCEKLAEENAVRANRVGSGISMWDLASSHNPIYRNIGLHYQRGDRNYVSRSLHGQANISAGGVAPQSRWMQDFNSAFGMALNYGLGGTLLAIHGSPILMQFMVREGVKSLATSVISAGVDVGSQFAVNLASSGSVSQSFKSINWVSPTMSFINPSANFTNVFVNNFTAGSLELSLDKGFGYLGDGNKKLNDVVTNTVGALLAFGAVQKIAPAVGSQMADNMRSGQVLMDNAGVPVLDSRRIASAWAYYIGRGMVTHGLSDAGTFSVNTINNTLGKQGIQLIDY